MTSTRKTLELGAERRPLSYDENAAYATAVIILAWLINGAVRLLRSVWQAVVAWRQRQQTRRQLSMLDDHLLRDIGLRRADIEYVATSASIRPFQPKRADPRPAANDQAPREAA